MGVRTEPSTGTRIYYIIEMRVEGRGNPGTFEDAKGGGDANE